jgi:hypothetical protein
LILPMAHRVFDLLKLILPPFDFQVETQPQESHLSDGSIGTSPRLLPAKMRALHLSLPTTDHIKSGRAACLTQE